jgi:hypothetical protein
MVALLYLKHAYSESDESLVERWSQDVYFQYFSGMEYFEPRFPCDATQIGSFRTAIGEAGVEEILKATIDTAVSSKAIKPADFERVIVDSTVQEKAVAFLSRTEAIWWLARERYRVIRMTGTSCPHSSNKRRSCWKTSANSRSRCLSILDIAGLLPITPELLTRQTNTWSL